MGAAKMTSVGSRIDPIGRRGAKGFYIHGQQELLSGRGI
jgi:hypothetical protein